MKHCPNCKRSFDDDSLSFCLDDGTPLIADSGSRADSQATLVSPVPFPPMDTSSNLPPTQTFSQLPGKATINVSGFNAAAQPAYVPPPKKSKLPLVLGLLVLAFLLLGGIVAAAIFIPQMLKPTANVNQAKPKPSPDWKGAPTPNGSPTEKADDVPDD